MMWYGGCKPLRLAGHELAMRRALRQTRASEWRLQTAEITRHELAMRMALLQTRASGEFT